MLPPPQPTVVVQRLPKGVVRTGRVTGATLRWLYVEIDGVEGGAVAFDVKTGLRRGFVLDPKGWGVSGDEMSRAVKWLKARRGR